MPELEVSVVIPVGRSHYGSLQRQIDALGLQATDRRYEIVVSDNGGDLSPLPAGVRVVDSSAHRGAGFARNEGVRSSSGTKILFCDADDVIHPGWIEAHAAALEDHRYTCGAFIWTKEGEEVAELLADGGWPSPDRFTTEVRYHEGVPYANSANCGIDRATFLSVEGFPRQYIRAEDVALGMRLHEVGVTPAFVPDAQVVKYWTGDSGRAALRRAYESGRSIARLERDFRVGPTRWGLVKRHVRRCAGTARRFDLVGTTRQAVQLLAVLQGFAIQAIPSRRSQPGGAPSGRADRK